ncbi:MAG: hypothetical protein AAFO98_12980 [Pseudomonadota bacterium]
MSDPTAQTRKQVSKARMRPPEAIGGIFIGRLDPAIDVAREVATALKLDRKTVVTERTGTEILSALDTSTDGSYAMLLPFTVGQIAWRVEATIPHNLVLPLALQGLAQR